MLICQAAIHTTIILLIAAIPLIFSYLTNIWRLLLFGLKILRIFNIIFRFSFFIRNACKITFVVMETCNRATPCLLRIRECLYLRLAGVVTLRYAL